jgi:type III restriction enzyme
VTCNIHRNLLETKGHEDVDVARRDRAAQLWCENATLLTETNWLYRKVPQQEFEKLPVEECDELIALDPVGLAKGRRPAEESQQRAKLQPHPTA